MRKIIGTGLPVGNGVEIFHSIAGSSKKILPINKEGLILYIPVDSNHSNIVFDVSEKLNHGTRYGAIVTNNGKAGEGLQFDGVDDYVDCGNKENLDFGVEDFSVLGWILLDNYNNYNILVSKSTGNDGFIVTSNKGTGELRMRIHSFPSNLGTAIIPLNEWTHIAVVYDRDSNAIGYINGNQAGVVNISNRNGSINNNQTLKIGQCASVYFAGKIDEMKIYNRALSPEEILADYQREV